MPRSYEPEDALEVLQQRDRGEHPVMTAPEVAEAMGASRPTANDRLNTLVGRGDVERLDVGPTAAYYLAGEDFTVVPAGDDQKRDGSGGIRTDDSESSKSEEEDVNKESTQETNADAEPEVRTDGGQTSVERAVDWAGRGATVLLGIAVGGIVSPPHRIMGTRELARGASARRQWPHSSGEWGRSSGRGVA